MGDVLRLRTMARKSVFAEGRYAGYSVQQMLDLKAYNTLRWYYYHYSMVSFLPDILEELHITEEWRIEKPGTDPAKYEELKAKVDEYFECMLKRIAKDDPQKAYAIKGRYMKKRGINERDKAHNIMNRDRQYFSKGSMQRRNHGHN